MPTLTEPIKVTLPLPPKVIHPNGRTRNHKYRAAMVRKCRDAAELIAMSEGVRIAGEAVIHAHWYFPQRKFSRHDDDNLTGWLKPARDGIASAAGIDDKALRMGRHQQDKDILNPRVELTITPAKEGMRDGE